MAVLDCVAEDAFMLVDDPEDSGVESEYHRDGVGVSRRQVGSDARGSRGREEAIRTERKAMDGASRLDAEAACFARG